MSFLFLEIKYAKMVGQSLERFKVKKESPFHSNCRCPVCGDSAKDQRKTRFHILEKEDKLICHCFNCEFSSSFTYFLKTNYPQLHNEYVFERYRSDVSDAPVITTPKPEAIDDSLFLTKAIKTPTDALFSLELPYVKELDKMHPVARYVASRHLPDYPFQYAENFYEFSSEFNEDLKQIRGRDEPRLIIPFFDRKGNVFAYQGRDLSGKSNQKYITIMVDKKIPKIFGIDRIKLDKHVFVCEGPLDSLFIENCLASVNASLVSTAEKLHRVVKKECITLIYDCEPRNKTICSMYESAIEKGFNIVIWPTSQKEKDINELILSGKKPQEIIIKNTYRGLTAKIMFDAWKRC